MRKYKLSIIIPTYNTEKFLVRCLESFVDQVDTRTQVILIDDGSEDGTGKLCDTYSYKYSQISVIHKRNMGLSAARNDGIAASNAEYLFFLDSDDYIDNGSIDMMLKRIKTKTDVYEFGFCVHRGDIIERVCLPIKNNGEMCPEEYLYKTFKDRTYEWFPWKYIFKTSLFDDGSRFPNGVFYEDVAFIPQILLKAKSIESINYNVYHYILGRKEAITSGIKYRNEIDKINAANKSIKLFKERCSQELASIAADQLSKMYYSALIVLFGVKDKNERRKLLEALKDNSDMIRYTKSGQQLFIAKLIRIIGIQGASFLLFLRMKIKDIMNMNRNKIA